MSSKTTIYLGGPGCGKTTVLTNRVKELVDSGVPPDEIGYVAFTRAAVKSMVDKLDGDVSDFPYASTLHSLGRVISDIPGFKVMGRKKRKSMFHEFGLEYRTGGVGLSSGISTTGYSHMLLHFDTMMRSEQISLDKFIEEQLRGTRYATIIPMFTKFVPKYKRYKEDRGLYDFTDMLEQALESKEFPELGYLFVDEAQDLSNLQWSVVQRLREHTREETIVAGDDKQAIYGWAGANVNQFIDMEGEQITLSKSYRLPRNVCLIAFNVGRRIKKRRPFFLMHRHVVGGGWANRICSLLDVPGYVLDGSCAVLARDRWALAKLKKTAKVCGLPETIEFRTIHSSKGLEWDTVILNVKSTKAVRKRMLTDPDEEQRVQFVGVSRARENLFYMGDLNT